MYRLSDIEIDYIQSDLTRLGIRTESIRDNILDHICILLENQMKNEDDFESVYRNVLADFYTGEIRDIENDARMLVLGRDHIGMTKLQFFFVLFALLMLPFVIYLATCLTSSTHSFSKEIWGPALAYISWPLSSLLVLFMIPDNMDPPIGKHARVFIGMRPVCVVINRSPVA